MAQKSPEFQRKLGIYQERMQKGRKIIVDSHIKLGYGTDFVAAYQNYESGMEFRCMMESGMDAFRILQAATKTNAEICEVDSITGTIEKANSRYRRMEAGSSHRQGCPARLLLCHERGHRL
ncbi:MAG: hypothetical protein ACLTR6_07320 [Clostridium fessum]